MGMNPAPDDAADARGPLFTTECLTEMIERLPVGTVILDADGIFSYLNAAAETMLGVARHALIGHSYLDPSWTVRDIDGHAMPPEARPIQTVMRTRVPLSEQTIRLERPDGAVIPLAVTAAPLGRLDQPAGYLVSFTDISAYVNIEQTLRDSEQRFRTIVETFPGFIWMTTAEPPFYPIFLSPQLETLFGFSPREFINGTHSVMELLPPGDSERLRRAVEDALARQATYSLEMRMYKADGSLVWVYGVGTGVYDKHGRVQYLLGSSIDITTRKHAEEELRRVNDELDTRVHQRTADLETERRRLRAVLDALPVGVALMNAEGAVVEVNAHFRRIWGGTAEARVPMSGAVEEFDAFCAWWADSQQPIAPGDWAAARALRLGETSVGEVIDILRFDGTCGTILNAAAPIRDSNGRIIGAVVAIEDNTEERLLEQDARASAATLYTMFDQVPMGVALFDEHLMCRQINATYAAMAHSAIGDIIGKSLRDLLNTFFPPPIDQILFARISHSLRTGKPHTQRGAEMRLRANPDATTYVDWSVSRVTSDEAVLGLLVTVTDVTEQTRARQQIEFERARWLTSLMTMPLSIVFITPDQCIAVANDPAQRLWGSELIQQHWSDTIGQAPLLTPDANVPIRLEDLPIARAMRGEAVHDFEGIQLTPEGRRVPVLINAAPVRLYGEIVGVIQVTQDLTRLKEADRVKDEFLAMVTHDLRSPLSAIKGWAEFGLETEDAALISEALHAILRSVAMQHTLVDDLLDASALQAGTLRLQTAVQDIRVPIADIFASFEPIARERRHQLVCDMPDAALPANIDTVRIQQLVGNLLGNAIKYTPEGGRITIRLARADRDIVIRVSDNGIGIAPERLPFVFERFFRIDAGSATTKSLGLGLAIVKALAELHGGAVTAESAGIDQGATFTVILPLAG